MPAKKKKNNSWLKKVFAGVVIISIIGAGAGWYIFNIEFADTGSTRPGFTVNALDFIHEFETNDRIANKKYTEKIVVVNGIVTEMEAADTTVNIKMADTSSGSYIIFAFQQKDMDQAKKINQGDSVSIKGSCSGGAYSQILETEYITFKRSTLNK